MNKKNKTRNNTKNNTKNNQLKPKGMTLIELVVGLGVISMVLMVGVPRLKSFSTHMEVTAGLRTCTSALSTARYDAIFMNVPVKFTIETDRIVLKKKPFAVWESYKEFALERDVLFSLNASPVFYPSGSIVPLCSIYVENGRSSYKITVSAAGMIKVTQIVKS
ncbi:MAG: Tfp pilus assembly protein FimT/FimU [Candidatus Omnitrophota bacterium]